MPATGPRNLRLAGSLADLAMPRSALRGPRCAGPIDHVRAGARGSRARPGQGQARAPLRHVGLATTWTRRAEESRWAADLRERTTSATCYKRVPEPRHARGADPARRGPARRRMTTTRAISTGRRTHRVAHARADRRLRHHRARLTAAFERIRELAEAGVDEISTAYLNGQAQPDPAASGEIDRPRAMTARCPCMKRLGVDVGGTFTDLILVDEDRAGHGRQGPCTPDDPSRGDGRRHARAVREGGVGLGEIDKLLHGTTVATNIVLTHTGAEVGLITTEGFRDILHIARHKKPLQLLAPAGAPWQSRPLVKRRHRLTVKRARDRAATATCSSRSTRTRCARACASCARPRRRGRRRLPAALVPQPGARAADQGDRARGVPGGVPVASRHEVLPLYREYERFSTVCLNAYVGPEGLALRRASFDDGDAERGLRTRRAADAVRRAAWRRSSAATQRPVNLLMSGPGRGPDRRHLGRHARGLRQRRHARHGRHLGRHRRRRRAAQLRMRHLLDTKIGDYQAMVPMVDIDTIGAGGGSIAYVDAGGVFRVGPAVRRRRPRPGLLRPRRDGADRDRRAAPARAPAARPRPARRPHAARRRPRRARRSSALAEPARHVASRRRRSARCRSRSTG